MLKLFKNGMQRLNATFGQYRQTAASAEDEDMAMSCGAFNPRFLAKIKRTKADSIVNPVVHSKESGSLFFQPAVSKQSGLNIHGLAGDCELRNL
jgi:hypothetical protein